MLSSSLTAGVAIGAFGAGVAFALYRYTCRVRTPKALELTSSEERLRLCIMTAQQSLRMMRGAWSIRSWVSYVNRALESPGSCLGTTISVCTAVTIFGVCKLLREPLELIPDPQTVPVPGL